MYDVRTRRGTGDVRCTNPEGKRECTMYEPVEVPGMYDVRTRGGTGNVRCTNQVKPGEILADPQPTTDNR